MNEPIYVTLDIPHGFAFRPYLVMPKWMEKEPTLCYVGYRKHLEVHYLRQDNPFLWWLKYFFNRSFRYAEEIKAYRKQWFIVRFSECFTIEGMSETIQKDFPEKSLEEIKFALQTGQTEIKDTGKDSRRYS